MSDSQATLSRSLSLTQATAINMIDMVGIGPFITLSLIVSLMAGPWSIAAWLVGAVLAYADGCVWAELGARWPQAGGSYVFLQKIFPGRGGRMMSFLFVWQTVIQAPLVVASAAIGFAQYFSYLVPLGFYEKKVLSGALVLMMVWLLYRNIQSIGKLSLVLWCITGGTLLWLIGSGIPHFHWQQAFPHSWPKVGGQGMKLVFVAALGQASLKAVYSYLGYYNVCHLGAEIKVPERNIPRAIFISISGIAVLYLLMQTMVMGNLDGQVIAKSEFVVSLYFEQIYNHATAQVATALILCIALASLFSVLLGYSRVPYAAAVDGLFFEVFGRVHPRHRIPHVSLLMLGGLGFLFSLLFKMKEVITAIITMRIIVQFLAQAVGVMAWHRREKERPWRMPLFPLPAILSMLIWFLIFCTAGWWYIAGAGGIIGLGIGLYWLFLRHSVPAKQ
ncbi:MAG: amino acid permease [Bacteroidetes bacterium]|nr:amino acid permease [Bacteroidota bacterium]MBS1629603.1 amino acid permease [Bacteroidota bacterium]